MRKRDADPTTSHAPMLSGAPDDGAVPSRVGMRHGKPADSPSGIVFPEPAETGERAVMADDDEVQELRVRVGALETENGFLRARLVESDRLATLGALATGIVHELNGPMTALANYAELLERRVTVPGAVVDAADVERVRRINEASGRLVTMTRDVLTFARPSADARLPIDVHGAIEQAISFASHEVERARVHIERRFGAPSRVLGAPQQIVQLFVNVLTNACHAADGVDARVIVTTSVSDRGDEVTIVFEDNGHGIDAAHLPRIFAPFFTTKDEGRGTGLGLFIVKTVVEAHDGQVSVERAGHGDDGSRGARFVVRLPCAR